MNVSILMQMGDRGGGGPLAHGFPHAGLRGRWAVPFLQEDTRALAEVLIPFLCLQAGGTSGAAY